MSDNAMQDRKTKAQVVYDRLLKFYGPQSLTPPRREPMHELISTMLSHRTTGKNESLAYERMWERFGSWEAIRDAPVEGLTEAIAPSNYPGAKAPNIKKTLARIFEERGEANIDFLAEMTAEEGLAWLTSLPGVGVKTATLVLLFCFQKPVLPVDTHVHRVSGRLGLIGPKVTANKAHDELLALLPRDPEVLFTFHIDTLLHGQRVCYFNNPACRRCPLLELCPYGQTRTGVEGEDT